MSRSKSTLYVTGMHKITARELAAQFEKFGRLVRCDIPAPRAASSRLFAFVEYEDPRDAEDAYYDMHNKNIPDEKIPEGATLKIEWARTPPAASWRTGGDSRRDRSPRRGGGRGRSRSYSPRRHNDYDRRPRDYGRDRDDRRGGGGGYRDRERSRSPQGGRDRDRDRDYKRGGRDDDRERDREERGGRREDTDRERDREGDREATDRESERDRNGTDRKAGGDVEERKEQDEPMESHEDLDRAE